MILQEELVDTEKKLKSLNYTKEGETTPKYKVENLVRYK